MVDQLDDPAVLSREDTVDGLRLGLFPYLSRSAERSNKILPKDGSELTGQLAYSSKTLPQITGVELGLDIGTDKGFLRVSSDAARIVAGVGQGALNDLGGGRVILFLNVGDFNILFAHNSIFAGVGLRMLLKNKVALTLGKGDGFTLHYDIGFNFWRYV